MLRVKICMCWLLDSIQTGGTGECAAAGLGLCIWSAAAAEGLLARCEARGLQQGPWQGDAYLAVIYSHVHSLTTLNPETLNPKTYSPTTLDLDPTAAIAGGVPVKHSSTPPS